MIGSRLGQILIAGMLTIAPLLFAPQRLLHPGPWVAFVAGVLTFLTQPSLASDDLVSDADDRRSALLIFVCVAVCQLVAILDYGYREIFRPEAFSPAVVVGASVVAAGLALRYWAIRTLGSFFTSTVHVADDQVLVDTGPYRWLRHPAYSGTILHCAGLAIMLASGIGVLLALVAVVPAYLYRVAVEEPVLASGLGNAYGEYRSRTWRLLPFVY